MKQIRNSETGEYFLCDIVLSDDFKKVLMKKKDGEVVDSWENRDGAKMPFWYEIIDNNYKKRGRTKKYDDYKQYSIKLPFELAMKMQEHCSNQISEYIKILVIKDLEYNNILTRKEKLELTEKNNALKEQEKEDYFQRRKAEEDLKASRETHVKLTRRSRVNRFEDHEGDTPEQLAFNAKMRQKIEVAKADMKIEEIKAKTARLMAEQVEAKEGTETEPVTEEIPTQEEPVVENKFYRDEYGVERDSKGEPVIRDSFGNIIRDDDEVW